MKASAVVVNPLGREPARLDEFLHDIRRDDEPLGGMPAGADLRQILEPAFADSLADLGRLRDFPVRAPCGFS